MCSKLCSKLCKICAQICGLQIVGPGLEGRTLPAGEESAAQFWGKPLRKNFEIGRAKNCAIFCAFLIRALIKKAQNIAQFFARPISKFLRKGFPQNWAALSSPAGSVRPSKPGPTIWRPQICAQILHNLEHNLEHNFQASITTLELHV